MAESTRPNIVFILTDDMGPWAAGCCGNPEIRTPNIDRLAADGVRFENFFCTSPVCSPARASILTGRIPSQHGVHDWIRDGNMPPDPARYIEGMTCYTDVLARNGYTCGLSGKWHLGDSLTPQHGFDYWFVMPSGASRYQDPEMIRDGEVSVHPGYRVDIITEGALEFIEANKDRTFYLSLHYGAPHSPWRGHPQDVVDSYDDCPFKSCPQEAMHPWAIHLTHNCMGDRESLKGYFAAMTGADLGVGRVLDRLEQLGLREDTLVVFTSDNGFSCGHHGFWGKGNGTLPLNMYDNSVKVPFIVSHPGRLPRGEVNGAMMSQYDIMPTLLDYAGLPPEDGDELPGRSFVPVWSGQKDEGRDEVVVYDEYGPVRMIRTREWKYVHRYPYGPHELFDLVNDPGERKNLADEDGTQELVTEMRGRLSQWFQRYATARLDGVHCSVTGGGQKHKVGPEHAAEDSFYPRTP